MASHFLPRIASRIKFLVSTIIQREISDPRLGLVTVLRVEPTSDLKEAKVYVSIFGRAADRSKTLHALEDARGHIQREVGKNLETRNTPRLSFIYDESQDKVSRIEALVDQAKEDREDVMAKKPGKKDEKVSKGTAAKPQKPRSKPGKAPKGGSEPPRGGRGAAGKASEPKGEEKELKSTKPPRKAFGRGSEDGFGGEEEKEFPSEDLPEEDEEKDFVDDFEDKDEDDLDEDEEEEEEEEEEEDDF